jgi:alkaline phosphatase
MTKGTTHMKNSTTVLAAIAAALVALSAQAAGTAKNILFFLGDGMGPTTVTATRIFVYGEGGKLQMEQLPRTALVRTYSLDAQTTDSAPSMSAYMTGVKMRNEVVSMNGDTVARVESNGRCAPTNGSSVPTFLELAKSAGKKVGAITTTELTHATPAATYAHLCHRDLAFDIATQAVPGGAGFNAALGDGVDVMLGGGANHWTPLDASTNPKGRSDGRNLLTELSSQGYQVVRSASELRSLPNSANKLIGLFTAKGHLAYELDRDNAKEPSLAEMTLRALEVLKRASAASGDHGFFLMVEGGRIDHALHATQAQQVLAETAAFDAAIEAAMSAVDLNETLVVVTADHDHTMAMNGYGQRGSGLHVLDVVRDPKSGSPLIDADGYPYPTLVFGNGPHRPMVRAGTDTLYVQDKNFLHLSGVNLSSETHGGGDVMLMAGGAESKPFKGTLDNTQVFSLLKSAAGL